MNLNIILKLSKIPGWITFLPDKCVDEAEYLHDQWLIIAKKAEKERHLEVSKIRKMIRDWVESPEMAIFSRECRERYLKNQLSGAVRQFQKTREEYIENKKNGKSDNELNNLYTAGVNLSKKINGYKNSIAVLQGKVDKKDIITNEMIERAREFPIINLVEINQIGRVKCPFHQGEHHNSSIKNNFFYCFVCQKNSDSIGLYRQIHRASFKEAILSLQ